jgi:phage protein D
VRSPKYDRLFDPGQEIELWMGYFHPVDPAQRRNNESQPLQLMLAGVITHLAPSFPSGGQPTLHISGASALIKLVKQQETHVYQAQSRDSDIAKKVGERGNLTLGNLRIPVKINTDAQRREPPHPAEVLQHNQFDIVFLLQLAHQNGYDLTLQEKVNQNVPEQYLYFGPSTQEPPASYELEWGKSLISFNPTLTTARQVNELTVRSWDPIRREPIDVTVNRGQLSTRPLADQDRLYRIEQGFRERHEMIVDQPFRNRQEAEQYARARLEELSKDMVTARGSTLGTPGLRVGRKFKTKGFGPTFDGTYFIKSTTHTIGASGYVTEFEARLEEANS